MLGRVKRQGCDPDKAFIMATTENIRSWLKISPEIIHLIKEITEFSITFQCHHDKFNNAIDHAATFLFEWVFASMRKGIPGYALEQFFNLGSQELRVSLEKKEDGFDEIIDQLRGIAPRGIHPVYAWICEVSVMHNHVKSMCDVATRKGVEAMIRQRHDEFLQNHIFNRVFPGVNQLNNSENFDAIRNSVDTISSHLCVTDECVIDKEAIQKELARYNCESQRAEEYVAPPRRCSS
jgi:hypothetical protein